MSDPYVGCRADNDGYDDGKKAAVAAADDDAGRHNHDRDSAGEHPGRRVYSSGRHQDHDRFPHHIMAPAMACCSLDCTQGG
eukprot:gene25421-biopygen20987